MKYQSFVFILHCKTGQSLSGFKKLFIWQASLTRLAFQENVYDLRARRTRVQRKVLFGVRSNYVGKGGIEVCIKNFLLAELFVLAKFNQFWAALFLKLFVEGYYDARKIRDRRSKNDIKHWERSIQWCYHITLFFDLRQWYIHSLQPSRSSYKPKIIVCACKEKNFFFYLKLLEFSAEAALSNMISFHLRSLREKDSFVYLFE